ncbi:hypothetical protein LSAT2_003372, partial [Lamellibrachia satsuma]
RTNSAPRPRDERALLTHLKLHNPPDLASPSRAHTSPPGTHPTSPPRPGPTPR